MQEINAAGGIDGRQLELITRDTQSDPTKAVNGAAANPDLKPELLRMQSGGAEAIMPWSVNAGFLSRIINTRGQMAWDVRCRATRRT